jgi:hypothetical protein
MKTGRGRDSGEAIAVPLAEGVARLADEDDVEARHALPNFRTDR